MSPAIATPSAIQNCVCAPELDNVVMRLDGGGACLRVDDTGVSMPVTNQLTVEGWVRMTSGAAGRQTIVFLPLEHQPLFLRLGGGAWEFGQERPRTQVRAAAGGLDRWLHVAGVCEPKRLKLYISGQLRAATPTRCRIRLRSGALIGAAAHAKTGALNHFFNGELSRLHVWSRALSAADLERVAGTARPSGMDLLADWPFNEGCGELACNRALETPDIAVRTCLGNARFQTYDSRPEYMIANVG